MPADDFYKIDEEFFQTIIENDVTFEGELKLEESLIIKGRVKGLIETKGVLVVGPDAILMANIKAQKIECYGKIQGNVTVEELFHLHNPSSIIGDIITPEIVVEKGCSINGRVIMKKNNNQIKEGE